MPRRFPRDLAELYVPSLGSTQFTRNGAPVNDTRLDPRQSVPCEVSLDHLNWNKADAFGYDDLDVMVEGERRTSGVVIPSAFDARVQVR